jgi:hypothetical protein
MAPHLEEYKLRYIAVWEDLENSGLICLYDSSCWLHEWGMNIIFGIVACLDGFLTVLWNSVLRCAATAVAFFYQIERFF